MFCPPRGTKMVSANRLILVCRGADIHYFKINPPKQNSPPGFYHYQTGTAHSSQTAFFENIFPEQKEGGVGGRGLCN